MSYRDARDYGTLEGAGRCWNNNKAPLKERTAIANLHEMVASTAAKTIAHGDHGDLAVRPFACFMSKGRCV